MNEYHYRDFSPSDNTLLQCIEFLSHEVCRDVSKHLDKHGLYKPDISTDEIEKLLGVPEVLERIWTGMITEEELDRPLKGFETWLQYCHTVENLDNGDKPRFELTDSESYDLLKCSLKVHNYIHSCPFEGVFDFSDCDEEKDQQKDPMFVSWENKIRSLLVDYLSYLGDITMDSTLSEKWNDYLNVPFSKSMDLLNEFFKGTGRIEKDGEVVITGPWDETSCQEFIGSELKEVVKSPVDMFMECFEMDEVDEEVIPEPCLEDHEEIETWNDLVKELESYCSYLHKEVRSFHP